MPEQTAVSFTWDVLIRPVFVFAVALLGWNIKRAHTKIDSFPKDYVDKEDYRADMKEIKETIRENQTILRSGVERIHDRIDAISKDK